MEALDAIDTLELDDFTVTETQTGSSFKVCRKHFWEPLKSLNRTVGSRALATTGISPPGWRAEDLGF